MTESMYAGIRAAEEQMRRAEQRAAKLGGARDVIAGLSGHGEAADGRVRAEWTAAEGLSTLEFDPRAMKMASGDLADAVKEAIRAASKDLGEQARQALIDSGATDEAGLAGADAARAQTFAAEQRARLSQVMRPAADRIAEATARRNQAR